MSFRAQVIRASQLDNNLVQLHIRRDNPAGQPLYLPSEMYTLDRRSCAGIPLRVRELVSSGETDRHYCTFTTDAAGNITAIESEYPAPKDAA